MIIIKVMGGLGNQMFQYALYKKLLQINKDVKVDIHYFNNVAMHNGYELNKVFDLNPSIATNNEIKRLGDTERCISSKIRRKMGFKKKSHFTPSSDQVATFIPEIFVIDEMYLDGYWQSEKYFKDVDTIIRKDFTFRNDLRGRNAIICQEILHNEAVSLHVRRGDYLKIPLYQNICTRDYYVNAINYISDRIKKPKFYIFSDDIEWCESNLDIKDATFVNWNKGSDSYIDMQLMSNCKYNIIANSSFSWWAAWLNNYKNKIVISPKKWFSDPNINQDDIIPETWIKI